MADDVDGANDNIRRIESAKIADIRKAAADIPIGISGECDRCGELFTRLVAGACCRCRDKHNLK